MFPRYRISLKLCSTLARLRLCQSWTTDPYIRQTITYTCTNSGIINTANGEGIYARYGSHSTFNKHQTKSIRGFVDLTLTARRCALNVWLAFASQLRGGCTCRGKNRPRIAQKSNGLRTFTLFCLPRIEQRNWDRWNCILCISTTHSMDTDGRKTAVKAFTNNQTTTSKMDNNRCGVERRFLRDFEMKLRAIPPHIVKTSWEPFSI